MAQTSLGLADSIYSIHDEGGAGLLKGRGTVFVTEALGPDLDAREGRDYRELAAQAGAVMVRLNYGYEPHGTIPPANLYAAYARRVAAFIHNSQGCRNWVVGNEPNHMAERPELADGARQPITPELYAECFNACARAVAAVTGANPRLWLAAVAPWNVTTTYRTNLGGDWIRYFTDMISLTAGLAGGITIHTYTHGSDPALIASREKMSDHPYTDRFYHFLAFWDFMRAIPAWARALPVAITEMDQNVAWQDHNSGWIYTAYEAINEYNANNKGLPPVQFATVYRWRNDDQWGIESKRQVQQDFLRAIERGHKPPTAPQKRTETHLPAITVEEAGVAVPAPTTAPAPASIHVDRRLIERGVRIAPAEARPGELYWAVTRGRWYSPEEAGGRHHIYATVLGERGERVIGARLYLQWPDGQSTFFTEDKPPGEPTANIPIGPSRNEYSIWVSTQGYPSELVTGIGMGADTPDGFNAGIHTASEFEFTLKRAAAAPAPAPTKPAEPAQPAPTQPAPTKPAIGAGAVDPYVLEAILAVESGGAGFNRDGSLKIRVEAHILERYLPRDRFTVHFRYAGLDAYCRDTDGAPWLQYHNQGQPGEAVAIRIAMGIDRDGALYSTSMGAPQIMGFHYADIGYPSVDAMYKAFTRGEAIQIAGFFNFLLYAKPGLWAAVQAADFGAIARLYNGNEAVYRPLLEAAYKRLTG